jgi:uncharacterized RDD family membrane protein YckC
VSTSFGDESSTPSPPYASWARRLVAVAIDGLIVGGVTAVAVMSAVGLEEANDAILDGSAAFIFVAFILAPGIYHTLMVGNRGQTIGKIALGIKIVDDEHPERAFGYPRAFRRWFATTLFWWLLYLPGILDHLWPLWDTRRQTWHDKVARSVVVRLS